MRNLQLQQYFKIWTVLLVVVPSLLIMVIYTSGQIQIAKQKNLELISQRVNSEKQQIDYWVEERQNDVRKISQLDDFKKLDEPEIKSTLEVMQQHSKDFNSLSFIDKDGFFRISTLKPGIRFSAATDQPYYQAALAGSDYMSGVVIGRNSGLPIINFSSPVYDHDGKFQGLVLGSVHTNTIETLLRENRMGQTGEIMLVTSDGTMIAEPRYISVLQERGFVDSNSRMKLRLSDDALRHVQLGNNGTASWVDYLGRKVIGAYRYLPEQQWTLIGSISEAEILDPIYKQLGFMAGGTLLLVLMILPLVRVTIDKIKLPIEWLIRQSRLVAAEEYQRVEHDAALTDMPSELQNLCDTFVRMSRKIENSVGLLKDNELKLESKVLEIQEINATLEEEVMERQSAQSSLQELNDKLEEKVLERTSQLQKMNTMLGDEIIRRQATQEELSQKTEEIRQMAYYDILTGLPNRAYLHERLGDEMELVRRGEQCGAVLFIDLDDLKLINDTFGHSCGDAVITMSGKRIVEVAGSSAFIGRIGGDEFIVLLPGESSREKVTKLADQIIQFACQDIEALGTRFHTSASVGIALYPNDGDTVEEICKNADNAMYAAKKAGKNCWRFYEATMQTEAYDKIVLINSLRHAVERNELLLHYQPQVNLSNGEIIGFEALARWHSVEHGHITPARFIPLAEQSGLIQGIGAWVLREASVFAKKLADSGYAHLHVAVNVSPYQLCSDGFIESVQAVLRELELEPRQIELEITETALIGSLEEGARRLQALKDLGLGLSLDDFGTGYSSLTYLQQLPVNTLKIDKAFIDMIILQDTKKGIIKSIVDMAHSLQMTVVAEGVETAEQLEYLGQCSCDRFQGYIISRPVPEEDAIKFLKQDLL